LSGRYCPAREEIVRKLSTLRRTAGVAVALLGAGAPVAGAAGIGTFSVFAPVPEPGQPEGLAVSPDGTVYAGTDVAPFGVRPEGIQPAKIFAFSPAGRLVRSYTIAGENFVPWYGLFGLAVDGDGIVYALDHNPARVLAIDPVTGAQITYASFPQLPPCSIAPAGAQCKDTSGNAGAFPNFVVFAPDGTMYVTDTSQALIWRVPPGGGRAAVFYTSRALESLFGPNDMALAADGRTLLIGISMPSYDGELSPGLYAIPIRPDGGAGVLRKLWQAQPFDFPEGGQYAQSGRIYVTAGGANQLVILSPDGHEQQRIPQTSSDNAKLPVPLNEPATVAFDGNDALITNHAWTGYSPPSWAIIDYHSGEPGLALFRPIIRPFATASHAGSQATTAPAAAALRITLGVSPRHARAGRLTRFSFTATATALAGGHGRACPGRS
jgi:sugar lactone lactonase YvrE